MPEAERGLASAEKTLELRTRRLAEGSAFPTFSATS